MSSSSGLTQTESVSHKQLNSWHYACTFKDLVPQSGICALINKQQIALFFLPGLGNEIYAIANWDPIGEANVLARGIVGDIDGEPVVASPLYKQHFSLRSGICLEANDVQIQAYAVKRHGDEILVQVPA